MQHNTGAAPAAPSSMNLSSARSPRLGRVALLETPGAPFGRALEQLVWNRSVDSVLLFGPASPIVPPPCAG